MADRTERESANVDSKGSGGRSDGGWVEVLARVSERFVPDAITTSIILMVILFVLSLSIGNSMETVVDAYYRGLWMLLSFTMQMTLVLVLSLVVAETPVFRGTVISLSRLPRTQAQFITGAALLTATLAYCNWGLAIALSPIIGVHFCRQAEERGVRIDFLWMMAVLAGAGSVWQFGLSSTAPLQMAQPGHFLVEKTGVMPLSTTIFSPASLAMVILFLLATILTGCLFKPRRIRTLSDFPESGRLAEAAITAEVGSTPGGGGGNYTVAQRLERSSLTLIPLYLALGSWLYHHFVTKQGSLDINSMVTILLLSCFVFHRSVHRMTTALQKVVVSAWPVIVMYHLYAGVAGLIQFTTVGDFLTTRIAHISNAYTLPFLTASISTIVALFIPTSGGQWLIQGFVTVTTSEAAGISPQRGLLALSVGDHMGNLISPFWAVVGAGIAKVDFRALFGYRLVFAAIWFVIGVMVFTFLPC